MEVVKKIEELFEKKPRNALLGEFKKMVMAEREIIEKLNVPLSHINPDNLTNISDEYQIGKIPDGVLRRLRVNLQGYLKMLKPLDFSKTVWEGRSFLGNPLEEFFIKTTANNLENLNDRTLEDAFKKAATEVDSAENAITATMKGFAEALGPQIEQSKKVMSRMHSLNGKMTPFIF